MKVYMMKKMILIGEPHHNNLGDNMIAVAERKIVKEYFSEYDFYAMPEEKLDICIDRAQKYINDEDVILFHGGGNLGDTYKIIENRRRKVIELFPNNKIIILPQTIYFSNTIDGNIELELTKKIYNSHKNLVMLAREEKSYEFMQRHFENAKVYLTPDIVMTMKLQENKNREGALLVFRNDREKNISDCAIKKIEDNLFGVYGKTEYTDMSAGKNVRNVGGEKRKRLLNEKIEQFQTSKMVVTDRLHGMIFAAITGTPCIAFGNFNHKVKESHNWLKRLGYIEFCNDIAEFESVFEKIRNVANAEYDNIFAKEILLNVLKEEIN